MSFKINLKRELYYQDIQIKELAAKINISYPTLLAYVNYKEALPNINVAYKIAKELNVSVEYLVTGNEEEKMKYRLKPVLRELASLPTPFISSIENIIHSYYEIYSRGERNEIISKKTSY